MNEEINQIVSEKLESVMFQVDYAHYGILPLTPDNFDEMLKYLETAEAVLDTKIDKINDRMETVEE